ncbi:MAG: hypothetical protein N2111_11475 [Candidatus Sumerlaeaceae bacterium]|nr:hypothetical protein [Candidatus Sumerlaeaceae bacterium]
MARKKKIQQADTPDSRGLLARLREMTPGEALWMVVQAHWRPLVVIVLFLAVWARPTFYPFVLDDRTTVSATVVTGRPARIADAFSPLYWRHAPPSAGAWRPLTALSFFVNGSAASAPAPKYGEPWRPDSPLPYRAVQVALLALGGWLVARLTVRLGVAAGTAWVAGLLFVIHPVRVDAVQRLDGRSDLLLTVFVAAGLLALLRYLERPRPGVLALLALTQAGAILASESGWILLPMSAAVMAVGRSGHRPSAGSASRPAGLSSQQGQPPAPLERGGPRKIFGILTAWTRWSGWRAPAAAALGVLTGVLLLAALARWVTLGQPGLANARMPDDVANPLLRHPWWPARVLTPVYAASHAWFLHFWPLRLKVDYGFDVFPVITSVSHPAFWKGGGLLVITAFACWWWRRVSGLAAGVMLFFLAFLPVSNLLYLNRDLFSERALTLAGVGWALAAAGAWAGLAHWAQAKALANESLARWRPATDYALAGILLVVLALSAGRAYRRVAAWRETESVYLQGLHDSMRSVTLYTGLANYYLDMNRRTPRPEYLPAAQRLATAAAKLDSQEPSAIEALARTAAMRFEAATTRTEAAAALAEALGLMRLSVKLAPDRLDLHARMAELYVVAADRMGDRSHLLAAVDVYRKLVTECPAEEAYWRAYYALLVQLGRKGEASAAAEEFSKRHPSARPLL